MALFSSNGKDRRPTSDRSVGNADGDAGLSIIAADLRVQGDLRSPGRVRIDGKVTGNVRAEDEVCVVEGGVVEGDIHTKEALVAGEVRGSVVAKGRIELHVTAKIHGTLSAPRLCVHEGGRVEGRVRMANANASSQQQARTDRSGLEPIATTKTMN